DDGIIRLRDVQSSDEIATFSGHIGAVKSLDFNPSGSQLASGGDDGTVKIWDIASRREIISIEVGAAITSAVFSPDGQQVLSAGQDGSLYLLDLASSSIYQTLPGR